MCFLLYKHIASEKLFSFLDLKKKKKVSLLSSELYYLAQTAKNMRQVTENLHKTFSFSSKKG